jgi:hypothetical protein
LDFDRAQEALATAVRQNILSLFIAALSDQLREGASSIMSILESADQEAD